MLAACLDRIIPDALLTCSSSAVGLTGRASSGSSSEARSWGGVAKAGFESLAATSARRRLCQMLSLSSSGR